MKYNGSGSRYVHVYIWAINQHPCVPHTLTFSVCVCVFSLAS